MQYVITVRGEGGYEDVHRINVLNTDADDFREEMLTAIAEVCEEYEALGD